MDHKEAPKGIYLEETKFGGLGLDGSSWTRWQAEFPPPAQFWVLN